MNDTIFTKILAGEIPCFTVYEDDLVLAFLDISQITLGHTLVIPKKPSISFLDTDDELNAYVFGIAAKLAKKIVSTLGATGCNILSNAKTAAGQEVLYLHVHIIPRYDENPNIIQIAKSTPPEMAELQKTQTLLTR